MVFCFLSVLSANIYYRLLDEVHTLSSVLHWYHSYIELPFCCYILLFSWPCSDIDGAYFGTTFPHLFLMTYEHLKPQKPSQRYVPRVFGFKLHKPWGGDWSFAGLGDTLVDYCKSGGHLPAMVSIMPPLPPPQACRMHAPWQAGPLHIRSVAIKRHQSINVVT
jgi:hypothetical protein